MDKTKIRSIHPVELLELTEIPQPQPQLQRVRSHENKTSAINSSAIGLCVSNKSRFTKQSGLVKQVCIRSLNVDIARLLRFNKDIDYTFEGVDVEDLKNEFERELRISPNHYKELTLSVHLYEFSMNYERRVDSVAKLIYIKHHPQSSSTITP